MRNTHFADVDLLFRRPPTNSDDDLVEIEFADMEPLDGDEVVGVVPLEAIALLDLLPYEIVGVGAQAAIATEPRPARRRVFRHSADDAEDRETEEYASWPAR